MACLTLLLGLLVPTGVVATAAGEEITDPSPVPTTGSPDVTAASPSQTDAPLTDQTATAPTQPGSATPETASPEPVSPESASPEPASPEPASPEPVNPEPADPEPANPEAAGRVAPMQVTGPYTITRDGITYTISKLTDGTGHASRRCCCCWVPGPPCWPVVGALGAGACHIDQPGSVSL